MGLLSEEDMHWAENGVTLCRTCHKKRHVVLGGTTSKEVILYRRIEKLCLKTDGNLDNLPNLYKKTMIEFINHVKSKLDPM